MKKKLIFHRVLFNWIRTLFEPKVQWSKIDKSCLVFSDFPVENQGWIKGWVKSKNEIVVCRHSNPAIGSVVHVKLNGEKIHRTITKVDDSLGNDIAICVVDKDWPEGVAIYETAKKPKRMQTVGIFNQDCLISHRRITMDWNYLIGTYYDKNIIGGDSGLPWFLWEDGKFKICSHTHRGWWGEGPNYSLFFK